MSSKLMYLFEFMHRVFIQNRRFEVLIFLLEKNITKCYDDKIGLHRKNIAVKVYIKMNWEKELI